MIDAHHHLWHPDFRHQAWLARPEMAPINRAFTVGGLSTAVLGLGIERTVVVQAVDEPEETRQLLALAENSPLIAGVVGWADLTCPELAAELARPGKLVGLRHGVQAEPDPWWLARPEVRKGLATVAEAGLVFDLLVRPHQLPAALDTVRALPRLTFVLDHLGKPAIASGELEPWLGQIRALAREPNVYAKFSGLVTEADWARWTVADLRPYAEAALEAFGPARLMFGSDWPVCLLAGSYAQVHDAAQLLTPGLSPSERHALFGGTAERVYRLRAPWKV